MIGLIDRSNMARSKLEKQERQQAAAGGTVGRRGARGSSKRVRFNQAPPGNKQK